MCRGNIIRMPSLLPGREPPGQPVAQEEVLEAYMV